MAKERQRDEKSKMENLKYKQSNEGKVVSSQVDIDAEDEDDSLLRLAQAKKSGSRK
jgi:hypothetical protein